MTTFEAKHGGRTLVRLLKALSRVHAFAEYEPDTEGERVIRVLGGSEKAPDVIQHVPLDIWERVRAAGLVEQSSLDRRWRISASGRKHLAAQLTAAQGRNGDVSDRVSKGAKKEGAHKPATGKNGPLESVRESPLAWLYRRRDKSGASLISEPQFHAGERLRRDFEMAQLMPRLTVNWQRAATGEAQGSAGAHAALDISERALAARERVSLALGAVGTELASVLVDVCCHLKGLEQLEKASGWPQRSGKIVLQVALSALARHYGIDRQNAGEGSRPTGPARVLHWGAEGYRPEKVMASSLEDNDT